MGMVPPHPLLPMGVVSIGEVRTKMDLPPTWGVTMQEAADALSLVLRGNRDKPDIPHFKDATNRPVFINQDELLTGQYEDALVDYGEC